jgi:release factor glutamine methyltransferase
MMTDDRSVAGLLRSARRQLSAAADGDAGRDAERLLCHLLGCGRSWLFAHPEAVPTADQAEAFERLVAQRAAGHPVAQLTGRQGFWTLDLEVDRATLIPRPETELLVEAALERLPPGHSATVADLGTGSGAVALAIASERPQVRVLAVDLSEAALAVARRNAGRLQIGNVEFRLGDWFAPLAGERFDLVVGNPPYIADDDPHLGQGDLRHEPRSALASGTDGLDAIRRIVADARAHLQPGGWLLLEHGWQQGAAVRALFEAAGLCDVHSRLDLEQRERITGGRVD